MHNGEMSLHSLQIKIRKLTYSGEVPFHTEIGFDTTYYSCVRKLTVADNVASTDTGGMLHISISRLTRGNRWENLRQSPSHLLPCPPQHAERRFILPQGLLWQQRHLIPCPFNGILFFEHSTAQRPEFCSYNIHVLGELFLCLCSVTLGPDCYVHS